MRNDINPDFYVDLNEADWYFIMKIMVHLKKNS